MKGSQCPAAEFASPGARGRSGSVPCAGGNGPGSHPDPPCRPAHLHPRDHLTAAHKRSVNSSIPLFFPHLPSMGRRLPVRLHPGKPRWGKICEQGGDTLSVRALPLSLELAVRAGKVLAPNPAKLLLTCVLCASQTLHSAVTSGAGGILPGLTWEASCAGPFFPALSHRSKN